MDDINMESKQQSLTTNGDHAGGGITNSQYTSVISSNVNRDRCRIDSSSSTSNSEYSDALDQLESDCHGSEECSEISVNNEKMCDSNKLADVKTQSNTTMLPKTDETVGKGSLVNGNNKDKECVADSLIQSFENLSISDSRSPCSNPEKDSKYPDPVWYYSSQVSLRTTRFYNEPGLAKTTGNGDILSSSENTEYSIESPLLKTSLEIYLHTANMLQTSKETLKDMQRKVDLGASLGENGLYSADASRFVLRNKDGILDLSKVNEQLKDVSRSKDEVSTASLITKSYAQVNSSHLKDGNQLSKVCQTISWEEKVPKESEKNRSGENVKAENAENIVLGWQNTGNAYEVNRSTKSSRPTNLDEYQTYMRDTSNYRDAANEDPEIPLLPKQSNQEEEPAGEKKEQKGKSRSQIKYDIDIPTPLDDRTIDENISGSKKSENDRHSGKLISHGEAKVGEMPLHYKKVDDKNYLKQITKSEATLVKSGDETLPGNQSETQPEVHDARHKYFEKQPQMQCPLSTSSASSVRMFKEAHDSRAVKKGQDNLAIEIKTPKKNHSLDDPKCKNHHKGQENYDCLSHETVSSVSEMTLQKNKIDNALEESSNTQEETSPRKEMRLSYESIGCERSMERNYRPLPDEDDIDYQSEDSASCELAYKKLSWRKYIKSFKYISEWEDDCKDSIEKAFSRSKLGFTIDKKSKFYNDFTAHEYHDMDDGICRGWNDGEYAYVAERITQQDLAEETTSVTKGGARPKTFHGNNPKDIRECEGERQQTNRSTAESDYENKDCGERRVYGLPNEDFEGLETNDEHRVHSLPHEYFEGGLETNNERRVYGLLNEDFEGGLETNDESEDDGRSVISQRARYKEFMASDTSDEFSDHQDEGNSDDQSGFTPEDLVLYLTCCRNFTSNMKVILDKFARHGNVKKFIEDHREVFTINSECVELRPKFNICPSFLVPEGCLDRSNCGDLHICDAFVLENCSDLSCINGHNLGTNHNRKILERFYMGKMNLSVAMDVLQKALLDPMQYPPLDICKDYNFKKCKSEYCKFLHICLDYVGGLTTCSRPECTLNHDPNKKQCRKVLETHGVDISNLKEDEVLFAIIKKSPEMMHIVQTYGNTESTKMPAESQASKVIGKQNHSTVHNQRRKQGNAPSTSNPPSRSKHDHATVYNQSKKGNGSATSDQPSHNKMSYSQAVSPQGKSKNNSGVPQFHSKGASGYATVVPPTEAKDSPKTKTITTHIKNAFNNVLSPKSREYKKEGTKNSNMSFSTVWSHYAFCDVVVPEICSYAFKGVCRYESTGCRRLHAHKEFHWQFKLNSGEWLNLQPHQVDHLEHFYCNPYKDEALLPLPSSQDEPKLINIVLKDAQPLADFQNMTLTNHLTDEVYGLRRLQTPREATTSSVFIWYFTDNSGAWIEYGALDSLGVRGYAARITSAGIEKKFQNGDAKINFKSDMYDYTLDLKKMLQVNNLTSAVREVRRRPRALKNKYK